jgi:hypothetical protein
MTFQHMHPEEEAGSTTNCWHNSVLKSMDYESSAQWLVINFSKELMRFGLEADMGLIRCRLDNELVKN